MGCVLIEPARRKFLLTLKSNERTCWAPRLCGGFNQILQLNSLHKCHHVLLDIFTIDQLWPFLWLWFHLLPGNVAKLFLKFCKHQISFKLCKKKNGLLLSRILVHQTSSLNSNMVVLVSLVQLVFVWWQKHKYDN